MPSLFSALHKYHQRADQTPQENQITEMLASVCEHEPSFATFLLQKCFPSLHALRTVRPQTQVPVYPSNGSTVGTKYIDLVFRDASLENAGEIVAVVEIKWWSKENWSTGEAGVPVPQTENYNQFLQRNSSDTNGIARLYITRTNGDTPQGWKSLRWSDIHQIAQDYLRNNWHTKESFGQVLLAHFITFLEDQKVNDITVEYTDLARISESIDVFVKMSNMLTQVANGLPKRLNMTFASREPGRTLASQLLKSGRYVLNWTQGGRLDYCFGIYPTGKLMRDHSFDGTFSDDAPVAVVWLECDPAKPFVQQVRKSEPLGDLLEVDKAWQQATDSRSWPIVYRSISLYDMPGPGTLSQRLETFFNRTFEDFERLKFIERMEEILEQSE